MAISMLKIRRPLGRLIFNMGIAISGKTVFLIETAPWARMARRNKETQETWVIDCKIMIKNNYGRISQISSEADLQEKAQQ